MPRKTFKNLSEEKRSRILQIALTEFAQFKYGDASISRIVRNAEIAKGSIYQYFSNKADLYSFLIHSVSERKLNYIRSAVSSEVPEGAGFYYSLKTMILSGARYDLENPEHALLIMNAVSELPNSEISGVVRWIRDSLFSFYKDFIKDRTASGDLADDTDPVTAAAVLQSFVASIPEILFRKYHIEDLSSLILDSERKESVLNMIGEIIDTFTGLLENGINSN